jgi:uncharacterized protein (TIGR02265 family)
VARIKGTQVADLVVAMRGMHKQGAVVVPEHLEHYLKDDVLVSNWYPEADFRDLMLIVGRAIAPTVPGSVWRFLGKQGATRDIAGIYANWVRQGDPERTLQLLSQGWTTVRDSGRIAIQPIALNHVEASLKAYPFMCPELAETNAGYIAEMVKASGVEEVDVQVREITEAGCKWKVTWR